MKDWKTTIGGIFAAAGTAMQASSNSTVKLAGVILGAAGMLLLGASARDSNGGTVNQ